MPFITQGKTNWNFLLIVIILAVIVGVGTLWYAKRLEQPLASVGLPKTEQKSVQEQACIDSGGIVSEASCCQSVTDFPDLCFIGACGCSSESSHQIKICDCGTGKCFNGTNCAVENHTNISVPREKFISIISPTKDEKWKIGESHAIRWESDLTPGSSLNFIELQKYLVGNFSGGVGFTPIGYIASISNNNPITWNVDKVWPNTYFMTEEFEKKVEPGTYRIRIFIYDDVKGITENYSELFQIE